MGILRRWRQRPTTKATPAPTKPAINRQVSKTSQKLAKIDHAFWQKFEHDLINADLAAPLVIDLILQARKRFAVSSSEVAVRRYMQKVLMKYYRYGAHATPIILRPRRVNIHLIVGVNGVGKTTTIAKLALFFHHQHQRVLVVAADTFRAGAVVQLQTWARRLKVDCFAGQPRQSPASVVYQSLAKANNYDLVLIDTAGRLHNKIPLMQEIGKIDTVITKQMDQRPDAVWLVMDAQTGRNAMAQARQFTSHLPVTGIILTKTDSTAKGGAAITLSHELKLPICWIGTGEHASDLQPFQVADYVARLVGLTPDGQ